MQTDGQLLLAGCGDIGLRIARLWRHAPQVTGLSRSHSALSRLPSGAQAWQADLDGTGPLAFPSSLDPAQTHIVYLAPPATDSLQDRRLEKFLAMLPWTPASFSYCSTSGIYGDCGGAWVDETTTPAPVTDRAKRRIWAEKFLTEWQQKTKARLMILRVPGIYGPGRLPLDKLRSGIPLIRPREAPWTNLIHADDLARVFIASIKRGSAGAIYNVSGGEPATLTDFYLTVARAAGLAVPEFISLREAQRIYNPERLSFINESRRLDVSKMRRELQPELRYADLASGVRASLDG
ncbi:MAG TPA: SDR family oxidoreductase [Gammaproteobacteria bacterium]|nr:SDR family oxidoreductase [Gammaproteobacteria bacterium]